MKTLLSALYPPPLVAIDLPSAPPFTTPDGRTLDDLERERVFDAIATINQKRREKFAKIRRKM